MKIILSDDFRAWLKGYIRAFENYKKDSQDRKQTVEQLKYVEHRIKDFEIETNNKRRKNE